MPTIYCSKCGRPLYDDPYGDTQGEVSCDPSCAQLARELAAITTAVVEHALSPDEARAKYFPKD